MSDHTSIRYASSIAAAQSTISNVRSSLLAQKPHITIALKGEREGQKIPYAFSTRDKIQGEVTVVPQHDVRFDDIYITFEGVVRVWTENTGPTMGTARSEVRRMFLKMNQPIDESTLPVPRIAVKGMQYSFPFSFVVPDQLLDSHCGHIIQNDVVRQAHLLLPPTMGTGKSMNQDGNLELDDVTPDMAKIRYGIKVRITRKREVDGKQAIIAEEQRNIHVTPAYAEAPPPMDDNTFVFRKEKDIRKGLFKGKLGRLIVQADPPRPMEAKSHDVKHRAMTTATLNLTFIPSDDSTEPPKLGNVTTKLKYRTFFSTKSINIIPQRKSHLVDPYMGQYQETITLSSRALNGIKWRRGRDAEHDSTYGSRRGSDLSDSASASSFSTESPNHYYAEILIPVSQPANKALPPTFQSCHVGRQYELDIGLSVDVSSRLNTSFNLKLPIQVTSVGQHDLAAELEAEELPAFEEFFTPRSIAPPSGQRLPSFSDSVQEEAGQLPAHMMSNSTNMAPPPGYAFPPVRMLNVT
ncbi:hypothetical protein H072_4691 [Dactylellina haptotyla CBS 200.50]|uniref:Arrestin-like N-terminal domain-containing protein n=1 Tax=Dactylellina haptotyla (strain CBS 200.50) TaxID=1284197 RepID=S8C1G4_DACHA|nr:hypothetical protein H072_4691 [Dactylellina haptotyla CBS 200.50]